MLNLIEYHAVIVNAENFPQYEMGKQEYVKRYRNVVGDAQLEFFFEYHGNIDAQ